LCRPDGLSVVRLLDTPMKDATIAPLGRLKRSRRLPAHETPLQPATVRGGLDHKITGRN
jgi:hypothetical protein